jgi:hypothetical protein
VAWWRKNQDRLTAQCVAEEKEIAELTEWWLTLIAVHEHYKFAGEAMRGLQCKTLLMEGQLERLEQLLNEVTNLHTIRKRAEIDSATGTAPLSADSEPDSRGFCDAAIAYTGGGLATVASRGC